MENSVEQPFSAQESESMRELNREIEQELAEYGRQEEEGHKKGLKTED